MLLLTPKTAPFAVIERPVRSTKSWPGSEPTTVLRLAGPVVLDAYESLNSLEREHWISHLIESLLRAALELQAYPAERVAELRSSAWRSAHHFITENVHLVDRGPELDELAKLLGVERPK